MKELFSFSIGKGALLFSWQKKGNFLAVGCGDRRVLIHDRKGKLHSQFALEDSGSILKIIWDYEDEYLAILQAEAKRIPIFNLLKNQLNYIETAEKNFTFIDRASNLPLLAMCNDKGNLIIYNSKTSKIIPVKGLHSKRIYDGKWSSNGNLLGLCGDGNSITINNNFGDTIESIKVAGFPENIQFYFSKKIMDDLLNSSNVNNKDKNLLNENIISLMLNKKFMWIYDFTKSNQNSLPLELSFQTKYEDIVSYEWFGDGYILIGFSTGIVVILSTYSKEIGTEIGSKKIFDGLSKMSYCASKKKAAFVDKSSIAILDLSVLANFESVKPEIFDNDIENGSINNLEWTSDGKILTFSTINGVLKSLITGVPLISESFEQNVVYLTSLNEICMKNMEDDSIICNFIVDVEPSFLGLGKSHVIVGKNNIMRFYKIEKKEKKVKFLYERKYLSTISKALIGGNYCCVLIDGKIILHEIETINLSKKNSIKREEIIFPIDSVKITSIQITNDFLIYSTDSGELVYFSLIDWKIVNDFKYEIGIREIFSNNNGTKLLFIDDAQFVHLFNAVNNLVLNLENISKNIEKVIWDNYDSNIFVVSEKNHFVTYVYHSITREGPIVLPIKKVNDDVIDKTERPSDVLPILMINGKIVCQNSSGKLIYVPLYSHLSLLSNLNSEEILNAKFFQLLDLGKLEEAWEILMMIKDNREEKLKIYSIKALYFLEVDFAIKAFMQLKNNSVTYSLQNLKLVDELNLLLANISMILKEFDDAEKRFLQSSKRIKALEMRRDLMDWERCIKLAETLDNSQIPLITKEYATQLELKGDYKKASDYYFISLNENQKYLKQNDEKSRIHNEFCNDGIVRCTIRLGDLTKGFKLAMNLERKKLIIECASIFEELKQYSEACSLYIKAEMYEKAAEIYVFSKKFYELSKIIKFVKNPKIFISYAKSKESENKFEEAIESFLAANDIYNVVRIYLVKLNNLQKAIEIVKNNNSNDSSILVARYCQKNNEFKIAIEFLISANKREDAFQIAQTHKEMDFYTLIIDSLSKKGIEISKNEYSSIGKYYESIKEFEKSGDNYLKSEEYELSLKNYLLSGDNCISKAIDIVGIAKNESLTSLIVDYLTGKNGLEKNPIYIFKLYIVLNEFEQATKTALLISEKELNVGNYESSKSVLFDTYKELEKHKIKIPYEIKNKLCLVQSYLIIKHLVQMSEIESKNIIEREKKNIKIDENSKTLSKKIQQLPVRMLIRIAKNISIFPKHVIPILTSAVIESVKCGLNEIAFKYAKILVKPENAKEISENLRNKLLKFVRKQKNINSENEEEMFVPCPFCEEQVSETELNCNTCKNTIPFCSITGKHIDSNDYSYCQNCNFPFYFSYYEIYSKVNKNCCCSMCKKEFKEIKKIEKEEAKLHIQKINQL